MQKIYIQSTLFFFYIITYNNSLVSMPTPWQKKFYYNPTSQNLVEIDLSHNNIHYDLQSTRASQNLKTYNMQFNLLSQTNEIIKLLINNRTDYNFLSNSLSQNLKIYNSFFKDKTQFKCLDCTQCFEEAAQLTAHKIVHSNKRLFQCSFCYHKFYTQRALDTHEPIHEQYKAFQCNICFKNFSNHGQLTIHQTSHSEQKPFVCSFCDKKFKTQQALKEHQNSHSTKAYFLCDYPGCKKKYKHRTSLCHHKKSNHTSEKEKKFTCLVCSKKFVSYSLATKHIKWSHDIKEINDINIAIEHTK